MKANLLIKHNIDALLQARGQTRRDLARWCLRTDAKRADTWIGHIFGPKGFHTREIPTKYLDRISDFFGVAVYQLFQPGITPLTERRKSLERRSGRDRRISQVVASRVLGGRGIEEPILAALAGDELDLIRKLRNLPPGERKEFESAAGAAYDRRIAAAKKRPSGSRQATKDQPTNGARQERRDAER